MGIDMILGIVVFIIVLGIELSSGKVGNAVFKWIESRGQQFGAKLMVSFLSGFIVYVLVTTRMPHPGQKPPVIFFSLLLLGANLFLVGRNAE